MVVTIRPLLAGEIITFLIIGDGAPRRVSSGVRFNQQSAEATVRQAIATASRQQTSYAARAAFSALDPSSIAAQLRGAAQPAAPARPAQPAAPTPPPRAEPARPRRESAAPATPPSIRPPRPAPAPEPHVERQAEEGRGRGRRPEARPAPEPEPERAPEPRAETPEITRQLVLAYLQSASQPARAGGAVNLIIQNSAGIDRLLGRASERREIFVEVFNAIYRRPWGDREYSRLFAHINRLASEQPGAFNDLLAAVQEGNGLSVDAIGTSRSGTALERAAVQALALFFVAQGDERRDGEFNGQAFSSESGWISTGLLGSLRSRQPAALDAELLALSALYLRRDITREAPQWERAIAGTETGRARETPDREPSPRPRPSVREEERRAPAVEEQGYRAREERARPAERRERGEERREESAAERREETRPPRRQGRDTEVAPGILLR